MDNITFEALVTRVNSHIGAIYPEADANLITQDLLRTMRLDTSCETPVPHENLWDQTDVVAITYGNTILKNDETPLETLHDFLNKYLKNVVNSVHILPFFPFSSDDGFAITDYDVVNPNVGDWEDIRNLSKDFDLMADLVVNHCSASHIWFKNFIEGKNPGKEYFYTANPQDDHSLVVRPRTTDLLQPIETTDGIKHVWCTFGPDQVDVDFTNPELLLEFIKIIRLYLDNGIRIFRLDAVAFIWKKIGTTCLNLNETHEIVRLLRTLIEHASPDAIIITETNIPNQENLSYFGNANEAHCIYNFSLPPLLVHSLVTGNARHLKNWLMSMPPAQNGTTYFNFIASHDGIGLRPVEGLLDDQELQLFIKTMESFGGKISWRALNGGITKKPYEVNIALYDALSGTTEGQDQWQLDRFIAAHTIMLALEGMPAFYLHSLVGTTNDHERFESLGHNRAINRKQWNEDELVDLLENGDTHHHRVYQRLVELIKIRRTQPAFHPNATQFTLHLGDEIFAFWRQSLNRTQSIFCLNNITSEPQIVLLSSINLISTDSWKDLLGNVSEINTADSITIEPYQSIWLTNR